MEATYYLVLVDVEHFGLVFGKMAVLFMSMTSNRQPHSYPMMKPKRKAKSPYNVTLAPIKSSHSPIKNH